MLSRHGFVVAEQGPDREVATVLLPIAKLGVEAVAVAVIRVAEIRIIEIFGEDRRRQRLSACDAALDHCDACPIKVVVLVRLKQQVGVKLVNLRKAVGDDRQFGGNGVDLPVGKIDQVSTERSRRKWLCLV